jgi:hypothetical protein
MGVKMYARIKTKQNKKDIKLYKEYLEQLRKNRVARQRTVVIKKRKLLCHGRIEVTTMPITLQKDGKVLIMELDGGRYHVVLSDLLEALNTLPD